MSVSHFADKPKMANWELTRICNMDCVHCFNDSGPSYQGELSTEKLKYIADQLSNFGVEYLIVTGGDPLVRKDIGEISSYIRPKFPSVILQTGGSLIPYTKPDVFKNFDEVMVSFYGPPEADAVFKKYGKPSVKESVEKLKQLSIPFTMTTVLTKLTKPYLDYMYEFSRDVGAKAFMIQELTPIGRAWDNYSLLSVNQEDRNNIFQQFRGKNDFVIFGYEQSCGGGTFFLEIDNLGGVSPCAFIEQKENIFENSLEDIWFKSHLFKGFREFKKGNQKCPLFIENSPYVSYKNLETKILNQSD